MTLTITVPNTLKTRTFDVERADKDLYILRGARGAVYGALRFVDDPNCLHIMKVRGACLSPFPGVVLTDCDGELRQI